MTDPAQTAAMTYGQSHPLVVLLVDDQRIIAEAVRRILASEPDIQYHAVTNPLEALETAIELRPTVILQDLVMPEIDGLRLVEQYRAQPEIQDTPLIVLSSKEEAVTKADAFARGANDYLVKLPDPVELLARIRYHSHAYIALLERNEAFKALRESQKALAQELNEAADYVRSLLPNPIAEGPIRTSWVFKPCSSLGGDSFGYFDIDEAHFAIFLLDVCNHGIGSALLSVTAMNAILGQTLVDVDFKDPRAVMAGLNDVFQMEKHHNLYFTLWYGVFNRNTRELKYASGGHPPSILMAPGDIQQLRTKAAPIGTFATARYEEASTQVPEGALLYVFSDGIYEVTRTDGREMELSDFIEILKEPETTPGAKVQEVFKTMAAVQGREDFEDDVSLVEFRF